MAETQTPRYLIIAIENCKKNVSRPTSPNLSTLSILSTPSSGRKKTFHSFGILHPAH